MVHQAVAEDYANDVINNMEDCEQSELTIFSETVKEKGSDQCVVTTGGYPCSNGRPGVWVVTGGKYGSK